MVTQELSIELKAHLNKADIKVMEAELKRLGSAKWVELTANLSQLKVKLAEAKWLLLNYQKAGWGTKSVTLTANVSDLQKQVSIANRALNNFVATWETTKSRMWGIMNSLRTWFLSTFGVFSIAGALASSVRWFFNFLSSSVDIAVSFESAFAWIKKTIDATDKQFSKLSKTLKDLSTKIPVTFEELSKIWEIWGQLWVWIADIDKFVESVARISASTNLTSEEAATAFAQIANLTKTPISQINSMADAVVELGNKSTATESGILEMSNRIAGAATQAGMANDGIFALATTLSSAWIEAEAWWSAMQKVLLTLQKTVISWWDNLEKFAEVAGMSSAKFAEWRKTNASWTFATFIDWLKKYWDQGILAVEDLFGAEVRQTRALLALTSAQFSYNDALKIAAWAEWALQQESEKRFWTNVAQLEMLNNQITLQKELIGVWLLPVKKARYWMILWLTTAFAKLSWAMANFSITMNPIKIGISVILLGIAALMSPIAAVVAWLIWLVVIARQIWWVVSSFKAMQKERRLFKDWVKDANWNLTEYGKWLEQQKKDLENYRLAQESATNALDIFNNYKTNWSRNRKDWEANRQAAIAEASAIIKATEALILKQEMASRVAAIWTSFWFQWSSTPLQMASKTNLDTLSKWKGELAWLKKEIYSIPKWVAYWPSKEDESNTKAETEAMKKLKAQLDLVLDRKQKIAEQNEKNWELFFDKIWDAIKSATDNVVDFGKEMEEIDKDIQKLIKDISDLNTKTQTDVAWRYVEAGNELDALNAKLLEQQWSLTDSNTEVTKLWDELSRIWDEVDTTPFRLILWTELQDERAKKQEELNKAISDQQKILDDITKSQADKLKLENEILLASANTTDKEKERALLLDSESETARLLRERTEWTAAINADIAALDIKKTAKQLEIDKENEYIWVLNSKKELLINTYDYLNAAQDKYNAWLDSMILKWKDLSLLEATAQWKNAPIYNAAKSSTSNNNSKVDNSAVYLSLHLSEVGRKDYSAKDLKSMFAPAQLNSLAAALAKKIALEKKTW